MSNDCRLSPKKHRRVSESPCSTNDLMPEHQKVQRKSQKIQSLQDKRRNLQKENAVAKEEMRKIREENDRNEGCRTKSIRTKWRMQKWRQSYRACRQEKKEEAAMPRKQVMAAGRPCDSSLSPWERMELRPLYKGSKGKWER